MRCKDIGISELAASIEYNRDSLSALEYGEQNVKYVHTHLPYHKARLKEYQHYCEESICYTHLLEVGTKEQPSTHVVSFFRHPTYREPAWLLAFYTLCYFTMFKQ